MREIDKFNSDLAAWESSAPALPDADRIARLRSLFLRLRLRMPEGLFADVFAEFLERRGAGSAAEREAAGRWLSGAAALLSGDYDQARFEREDWEAFRELVSANADSMPLEVLTEILSRVLEAGAIG